MDIYSRVTARQKWAALVIAGALVVAGFTVFYRAPEAAAVSANAAPVRGGKVSKDAVRVGPDQLGTLDVGPLREGQFSNVRQALGIIDFNQDRTVPVFSAYQGRIAKVLVKAGDEVKMGQTLYTVNVPDVAQAASSLIAAAGVLRSANETLRRASELVKDESIPQKEYQQNQADQQTAEGNYNAARKSLNLFGLTTEDVSRIEKQRAVDIEIPIKSPINGRVTARSAQIGLVVLHGAPQAPVTVADLHTLWMVASVPEADFSLYRIGQPVSVRVQAWPGKIFAGRVSYLGDSVDPNTRRLSVRAEINDPAHQLRPQMSADFIIAISAPELGLAAPAAAVVREVDGANAVWILSPTDVQVFMRRKVTTGRTEDGQVQILSGLQPGERLARKNALFLSNLYETATQ